jgi:peptidoglycan/LPS O-acetylase OafA/YrhL
MHAVIAAAHTAPTAPTSTGEPAGELQPPKQYERKPAMPAITGLRTLLALTIILFHFTPGGLTWTRHPSITLYPLINIGFVFVSFFFLISGFILAYNYADRPQPMNAVDFWVARFSRLYPVYVLTMLISIPMLMGEWAIRSRTDFWMGAIATPLLVQGFFPHLATFWMTVTWTLSCEVMLYIAFPWLLKLPWPRSTGKLLALGLFFWVVGLIPHSVYVLSDPDHFGHLANRYDDGLWVNTLKYTPLPYVCTFLAGLTLGHLQARIQLTARGRVMIGTIGFLGVWFAAYHLAETLPYIMVHGGLLTPLFAMIILGLSGPSVLASLFSWEPLVAVGASTYALYLLHFNVYLLLHEDHVWERLHLTQFDPWISYVFVILLAVAVRKWVEHPAQVAIGRWWKQRQAAKVKRAAVAVG